MSPARRRILLGVSGGVAAYKACELCRRLRDQGADVRVVMTAGAEHFVTATTLQALSGQPVRSSLWDAAAEAAMGHIELARWAQQIVIAPASADMLARLAHGLADDLLTTVCLASGAPLFLAPAMNRQMWAHPATQANVDALKARGARVLGPSAGEQACGDVGPGRMLEVADIVAALVAASDVENGALVGLRVLVSAGPTLEDIDPVRFLGNRSSGRMGFAVAAAAAAAGAVVTLVAGPVQLPTPAGVARRIDVRSAAQMLEVMRAQAATAAIVIGVAAVADYRPAHADAAKLQKTGAAWQLTLIENPDILRALAQLEPRPFLVGFAAETDDLEPHALAKLERKGIDMIAANRVGDGVGFDVGENALIVYSRDAAPVTLPRAAKPQLARSLIACIAKQFQRQPAGTAANRDASAHGA